jgi:dTDP-4-dehydrorhamnose 3,5-epimerase-like enzyme
LIEITTLTDARGCLSVAEKGVPFRIKRVFYTYKVPPGTVRGGHGHKQTTVALIAVAGICAVNGRTAAGSDWKFRLSNPSECLVIEPGEWHQMQFEEPGTVLLCLASEEYDADDYFYEPPAARL